MPIPFLDLKDILEAYEIIGKHLHHGRLDRIVVSVAIYHDNKDWSMYFFNKKEAAIKSLKWLLRLNTEGENPDTNKIVKESKLFLLLREKNGSIRLLGPVNLNADISKNRKQKAERLSSYLLHELKEGLGFLISFRRYNPEGYIFIFFAIKKDIIEKGELEQYEIIREYLDSKELKSYIEQFTGMKEQEFKEKLATGIFFAR